MKIIPSALNAIGWFLIIILLGVTGQAEGAEQLAYAWRRGARYGLSLATMGHREEVLYEGPQRLSTPRWFPRGDAVIFARDVDGQWQLFRLALADRSLRQMTTLKGGADEPRVSPDGRQVAYRTYIDGVGPTLFVMDAEGDQQRPMTTPPMTAAPGEWLPGTTVYAFLSEFGGIAQVWLFDAETGRVKRLTGGAQLKSGIMPSPDGQTLAVHKVLIDVGTGKERRWAAARPGVVEELATWNPAGTAMVCVSNRDKKSYEIYRMNPDGTGEQNLTRHPAFDSFPAWSPEGSLIAFTSGRRGHGQYEIYTMDPNGDHVRQVTHGLFFQFARPVWRPPTSEPLVGTEAPRKPVR